MLILLSCVPLDTKSDLDVVPAGDTAAFVARWTSLVSGPSQLEVRFDDETLTFSDPTPTDTHELLIVGVPPRTVAEVAVIEDGAAGGSAVLETPALPSWAPDLDVAVDDPALQASGLTLVPLVLDAPAGVLLIDGRGRPVWAWPPVDGTELATRARLSLDGRHILFNAAAPNADDPGLIQRVSLADGTAETVMINGLHLDFAEYTDGGYLGLSWEIRELEGRRILADTVVERDPSGAERVVWSAWDWFEPDLTRAWPRSYPADLDVEDWTHINGLSYDPVEDAVYLTMTFNNGVAKLDRASGELLWVVADQYGNVRPTTPGLVELPHSAERTDTGDVLVFNRGDLSDVSTGSAWVVEIDVDTSAGTASEIWSYEPPDPLVVGFLGSAARLDNGNTLISWSSAGRLEEVTADGEVALQLGTALGSAFGFASRIPAFGQ